MQNRRDDQLRKVHADVAAELTYARNAPDITVPTKLQKHHSYLLNNLPAVRVADKLESFTEKEKKLVKVQLTNTSKNRCLLKILAEKGENGMKQLEMALEGLDMREILEEINGI